MNIKHVVIPIFVPHKGCPHDCIFCNQKVISGELEEMTVNKLVSVIENHLTTLSGEEFIEIGFYGGSFTGIEKDKQIEFLKAANSYIKGGKVREIRLSTRPDYINEEILDYLKHYNVKTIELGVQSMNEEVLKESQRGHSVEDVVKSSNLIKNSGIKLGIQTMIGLPGDSEEKDIDTAKKVINIRPSLVRIYPTLVVKDTYLEKLYYKGEFIPYELDKSVEICSVLLDLYERENINVIRIGLQPTENINNALDVITGPFHPSFRQLVESRLLLKEIEREIVNKGLIGNEELIIYTNNKYISSVIGQKRANIEHLKNKFKFKSIKVELRESNHNTKFYI